MPHRRYTNPVSDPFAGLVAQTGLPTDRPIAIYYRQSTEAQVGNISTSMQTVDMVSYLETRGWTNADIILIDMDAGISGMTKIDERPGMSKLFHLISMRTIGAVACQDEDRLFRDVTQIQVNIFIEACRSNQVQVITPSMVYEFAHPQMGMFHARQFRFKSEMAAEYINAFIKGRLHTAKRRLLMEGRWAGPPMPVGFMTDMRKQLDDGSSNPHWRKFSVFEPYAEVVAEYFRLFLSYSGNLRKTLRHIHRHGPFFPDPTTCQPPTGYKVVYRIRPNEHGWCPSARTTLYQILTNAMYIGHWMVNGAVVRWNNHPSIVSEETFMRAFNYLSSVAPDGSENEDYRPNQVNARPTKEEDRPAERPLCAGLMVSEYKNQWRQVGTNWVGPGQHYAYTLWSPDGHNKYVWGKKADYVDAAIGRMLVEKLSATFKYEAWEKAVEMSVAESQQEHEVKRAQLVQLESVMANLVTSLGTLTNPQMIRAAEQRYEAAQAEFDRLQRELQTQVSHKGQLERVKVLKDSCGEVLASWPEKTMDEKREVVRAFIDRVEATPTEAHGLHLVVCWKDGTRDAVTLPRQATTGVSWLPEEVERLLALADAGVGQTEIAKAFPERKWANIRSKYYLLVGNFDKLKFKPKPIHDRETYWEYEERVGKGFNPNCGSEVDSERVPLYGPC